MARQETFYVRGAVEHLIFYKYRDTYCCRSRPTTVNQTDATRTSGKQFGQAARLSRLLRESLASLLPNRKDKKMMYRLNDAFFQWLRKGADSVPWNNNLPSLQGFLFTTQTELSTFCPQAMTVNWEQAGQVTISILEMKLESGLTAPEKTEIVYWKVTVCSCPLEESIPPSPPQRIQLELPYQEGVIPAQELVLPFTVQPGAIAIVAAALAFEHPKQYEDLETGSMRWKPAGIVGGWYRPVE
jgi:hypothetical protein